VVTKVAELFAELRSVVTELMFAIFVLLPLCNGLTVIAIVAVALLAILPRLTVTMPLVCEYAPCEVLAVTKETPGGSVSVSTELPAVDGPLLVTLML